jgi:CTP synthase
MSKFIFVTGGVVSSLGKGIAVASIARILKSRGISVSVLKLDPYLNVDPGTMSPYQHGEVFVTGDGSETDLDLGHYERFIGMSLTGASNLTAGKIYSDVIAKERKGEFLGGTIQVVPHVTDAIKSHMFYLSEKSQADVIVVEVGGTVGDIEGLPFLEAIRQMRNEVGSSNVFYVHLTYLPYVTTTNELKTKPTQHSVRELRSIGILPDAIICRSDHKVSESIKDKITIHCDVPIKGILTLQTVESVYEVPSILEKQGLGDLIFNHMQIQANETDMHDWNKMVDLIKKPKPNIKIAVVGKYVDLTDSYISVKEALIHAGIFYNRNVELVWINSEDIEKNGTDRYLSSVSGIVVPGGFGPRGIEGMIDTVRYSIENNIPYLGLCLGMQVMVISVARSILGREMANSLEFSTETPDPVISLMHNQKDVENLGGTMRLGIYPCEIVENSISHRAYGSVDLVQERHRHRFEFNNEYRKELDDIGLKATGLSPDGNLVEIMELESHPFMVGVQFHPEFLSRPDEPHPLFSEFIKFSSEVSKNIE